MNRIRWQDKLIALSELEAFRVRASLGLSLLAVTLIGIVVPLRHFISPISSVEIAAAFVAFTLSAVGSALIFVSPKRFHGRYAALFGLSLFPMVGGYADGGLDSPAMPIVIVFPLIAAFCAGRRAAIVFTVFAFTIFFGFYAAKSNGMLPPSSLDNAEAANQAKLVVLSAVLLGSSVVASLYERIRADQIRTQAQLDLAKAKGLRHAKLASLGEMAAGVAHEINNPLAIILGHSENLLSSTPSPEVLSSQLLTIQRASDRIARIVRSLRRFSRSEADRPHQEHHLPDLIREAMILTDAKARQHSTNISVSVAGTIRCNDIEIEQVIVNLINNAIDAVKDLPDRWVKITVQEDDASVVLRVRDSGTRIAPEIQQRMFQPFFTTKPVGEGTGLGLSIVKGILDDHKATIDLIADDPHTCFEIRFARSPASTPST